jgi:DNA-directed RNA polymerase specialized sigma24 family protein
MIAEIIPCKLIERQQYKDLALSITANMDGERVQSTGPKSKLELAVAECEAAEGEVLDAVIKLIEEKNKRTSILEQLDTPIHYKILHMKYIQNMEFVDIADALKMEYTNVTTTHGRALAQIQRLMEQM